jgi:hypothetical protein
VADTVALPGGFMEFPSSMLQTLTSMFIVCGVHRNPQVTVILHPVCERLARPTLVISIDVSSREQLLLC